MATRRPSVLGHPTPTRGLGDRRRAPKIGRTHSGPKRTIPTRRPIIHKGRGVRQKVWLKPVAVGATGRTVGGGIVGTAYAVSDTPQSAQLGLQARNEVPDIKRIGGRKPSRTVRQHTTGPKKGPQTISNAGVGKGVFDDIHSTVQNVGDAVQSSIQSPEIIPQAHATRLPPSSPDPFGGVVAIGQDFYTGASDVVSDFGTTINPASFVEPFFEEPITPATYDKVTGEMLTEAVWKPIPKSKSTIYRLQDAATEQAFHFAFDRPEFERLSQEGALPFDVAYRQEFSGANKISTARLMGELTAEAGLWVGTFAAGRAIWGVGRGVKLASTASKLAKKGKLPSNLVDFPRTKMGGAKKGFMEAIGTTGKDPFLLGLGPSHIPKRIPLIGGRGSTKTQFSLPRGYQAWDEPLARLAKKAKKPKTKKVIGTIQNRSARLAKTPKKTTAKKTTKKTIKKTTAKKTTTRVQALIKTAQDSGFKLSKTEKNILKKTTKNSGASKSWYDRNVGTGGGFIPFKGVKRVSGKVKKGVKKRFPTKKKAKPKAIVKSVNAKRREKDAYWKSVTNAFGKPDVSGSGQ